MNEICFVGRRCHSPPCPMHATTYAEISVECIQRGGGRRLGKTDTY